MNRLQRSVAALVLIGAMAGFTTAGAHTQATSVTRPMTTTEALAATGAGCFGCGLAVVTTLSVSASAVLVGGPAGLAFLAIGKGLGLAAMIDSCSTCGD